MDLLTDLFKSAGQKQKIWHGLRLKKNKTLLFPCERSIGLHLIVEGPVYLHCGKKKWLLKTGDIAFMARGVHHHLSLDGNTPTKHHSSNVEIEKFLAEEPPHLVSAAIQFWNDPIHPLLQELPDWFILESDKLYGFETLRILIDLLKSENHQKQAGHQIIIDNLTESVFIQVLRRIIENQSTKEGSWSQGYSDPLIRKSLELIHKNIAKDWSLESLAKEMGLSRNGFSTNFKNKLGESPIQYLTKIRLQESQKLLSTTELTIETIAEKVGYNDAFTFSKAFKRKIGLSPKDFRKEDLASKSSPFRF